MNSLLCFFNKLSIQIEFFIYLLNRCRANVIGCHDFNFFTSKMHLEETWTERSYFRNFSHSLKNNCTLCNELEIILSASARQFLKKRKLFIFIYFRVRIFSMEVNKGSKVFVFSFTFRNKTTFIYRLRRAVWVNFHIRRHNINISH